jgi:Flp pilus assembly protein TadG
MILPSLIQRLRRARSGSAAGEFALTIPVAVMIIFGTVQLGAAFWANAGLQNGVGEAARVATLWPARSDSEIRAKLNSSMFGVDRTKLTTPAFVRGTAGGQNYVDISVSYQTSVDMLVFEIPLFTIRQSRRAYVP